MMNEQYMRSFERLKDLPIYDEHDPACDKLLRSHNPLYTGDIYEASDRDLLSKYLYDSTLVPVAAIRYSPDHIWPIFLKLRD